MVIGVEAENPINNKIKRQNVENVMFSTEHPIIWRNNGIKK